MPTPETFIEFSRSPSQQSLFCRKELQIYYTVMEAISRNLCS